MSKGIKNFYLYRLAGWTQTKMNVKQIFMKSWGIEKWNPLLKQTIQQEKNKNKNNEKIHKTFLIFS